VEQDQWWAIALSPVRDTKPAYVNVVHLGSLSYLLECWTGLARSGHRLIY
jgi:hypothetical protein